jgi:hypothetical protein
MLRVVTASGIATRSEKEEVRLCAGNAESTSVRVKVVPGAVVGVPEMIPEGLRERPAGSTPEEILQVSGEVPPVAVRVKL